MNFSAAPFTTVLSWCEKHGCNRIEMISSDNNKVNVNVIWKGFNINMVIDTQTTITETQVKKPVDDGHETIVSINSNLSLVDTLNYFESLVK